MLRILLLPSIASALQTDATTGDSPVTDIKFCLNPGMNASYVQADNLNGSISTYGTYQNDMKCKSNKLMKDDCFTGI